MDNELFKKFTGASTICDKLKIHAARFDNDYFFNQDLEQIEEENEFIKPLVKITPSKYKQISRDVKCKGKKLSFALENIESDYCLEFKIKYNNQTFKNISEGVNVASTIYKNSNAEYKPTQATVSSNNGKKVINKKETNAAAEINRMKQHIMSVELYDKFKTILNSNQAAIKTRVQQQVDEETTKFAYNELEIENGYIGNTKDNQLILLIAELRNVLVDFN